MALKETEETVKDAETEAGLVIMIEIAVMLIIKKMITMIMIMRMKKKERESLIEMKKLQIIP